MATPIAIVGQSGTGKSTSIEKLNPESTAIINVSGKKLPFKGASKLYNSENRNYKTTKDPQEIINTINKTSSDFSNIKILIIDDFQYIMAHEFMSRAKEKGFDKWVEIGQNIYNIMMAIAASREDLNVYILTHDEVYEENYVQKRKIKTLGKLLDQNVTMEGLFSVVLFTEIVKDEKDDKLFNYRFITQNNGKTTAKSPKSMFENYHIENDLSFVDQKIREYD